MDWFRHYHGLCTDPKLHRVARTAGVSRGLVVAAWCAVLETASASTPRGSAAALDHIALAFMVDIKPHIASKILDAIRIYGLLDSAGDVTAWERRQRSSDDVAVRKRNQRDRERDANPLIIKQTADPRHVTVPSRTEQNRTEQKDKGDSPLKPPRTPPKAGTFLPPDWQPDPTDIEFALKEGLSHDDANRELGKFRDYWASATGARARKSDWAACWRNWIRKAADDRGRAAGRSPGNGGGSGGNRRAPDRQAGRLADTLAVLHRRGSLEGCGVH
jgi:hypothetical protein